jgi:D-allose transport system substrate-binding protein
LQSPVLCFEKGSRRRDEGKPLRIAVLLGDLSNPFWEEMERAYRAAAKDRAMTVEFFRARPEKDREAQAGALLDIITMPFDAIVVNPISSKNLAPGIIRAAAAGIPVLDVGAKTDPDAVKGAGAVYHAIKTVDFFRQGLMGGTYICRRLGGSVGGKVAILEGRPDSVQSIGRTSGALHAFLLAAPSICLAFRDYADFDRAKAAALSRAMLAEEPDLKAFFCANDVMALGVVDTIQTCRAPSEICVVGVDLTPEGRGAIRQGLMAASVAFSPASVADVVLDAVRRIQAGEKPREGFTVTSTLVTRENIDSYAY